MPKKKSSKTPSIKAEKKEEEPVLEQKKLSLTPKKAVNEIDEIFAGKKRKKPEKANGDEISKAKLVKKKKNKKWKETKETKEEGFSEPYSRPRKRTADGFAIYSEEELEFEKGLGSLHLYLYTKK